MTSSAQRRASPGKGLRTIAIFELAKGALVLIAGWGLLGVIHRGAEDVADRIVSHFHLNLAHDTPRIFIQALTNLTNIHLWLLAAAAVFYVLVRFTEAAGLWYGRRWASWLGLSTALVYIPWEIYEMIHEGTWPAFLLFGVNTGIAIFLASTLTRKFHLA